MVTFYKLFDLLRRNKIQQKELVKKNIISNGTLQNLRQNKKISVESLFRICHYLNCKVEDVCEYIPEEDQ